MHKVALVLMPVGASLLVTSYQPNASAFETSTPAQLAKQAPKLKLDQSNSVTDPEGLGLGNGLYGQTFVPTDKNLTQVDFLLTVNNLTAETEAGVGLYTEITKARIATSSTSVAAHLPGELVRIVGFRFNPPVPLDKKTTYTIGCYVPSPIAWQFSYGDPYPSGQVVLYDGIPLNPAADFVFTTYSLKP